MVLDLIKAMKKITIWTILTVHLLAPWPLYLAAGSRNALPPVFSRHRCRPSFILLFILENPIGLRPCRFLQPYGLSLILILSNPMGLRCTYASPVIRRLPLEFFWDLHNRTPVPGIVILLGSHQPSHFEAPMSDVIDPVK